MKTILKLTAVLAFALVVSIADFEPYDRDYTGLTDPSYMTPDIAIDTEKEYKDGYMRLLWSQGMNPAPVKTSMKYKTDRR